MAFIVVFFPSHTHTNLHIPFVYFDSCISFLSRCVPKHFHLILQKALKVTKFKCLKIVERLMGIIIATNSSLHQAQPSQPVVVVRLFNNFKSISCCKIVWWRNKRRWIRAKWIIRGRKFRMKWILLPVRYHSLFICLLIVLFTLSLDPFNVYKKKECPSCDGSGSLTSSGQVDGKTERIKNECSMMRHKKVACKAFSITPHKFLHFDMKKT